MEKILIRSAKKADLKSLAKMPPYSKNKFERLDSSEEEILVAESNNKILGAASIGFTNINYVPQMKKLKFLPQHSKTKRISDFWIWKLYVFPEYRGQNVGKELVRECVGNLKKKGVAQVYAAVNMNNPLRANSEKIFELNGFRRIGSCVCPVPQGFCQGTLFKKAIKPLTHGADKQMHGSNGHSELTEAIKTLALSNGAELVGFASAKTMEEGAPNGHKPSDLMPDAKSVIILACGRKLNEDREYFYKWGPHFNLTYIRLKDGIDQKRKKARQCIDAVKAFLEERRFKVATEPHGWSGILSFKMACILAGIGVLGKGSFVVNPQLGHINVLACILTDAPLNYGTPLKLDVCKECIECIKACKYGAFQKTIEGFKWIPEKCRCYDLIMNPVTLKWTYGPCNSRCVHMCPIGKSS